MQHVGDRNRKHQIQKEKDITPTYSVKPDWSYCIYS